MLGSGRWPTGLPHVVETDAASPSAGRVTCDYQRLEIV